MMTFRKGDIVLVEFIFSEGRGWKKRPALIISSDKYNSKRQEVIVAAVTSNIERILPGDTKLGQWKKAGLLFQSAVVAILQTIKKGKIIKKLGFLSEKDLLQVEKNIGKILGY
ncbi:type II toxin-antitoxin system PemK/MazF family toxin [Candidatus Riflebacteria bacterium]